MASAKYLDAFLQYDPFYRHRMEKEALAQEQVNSASALNYGNYINTGDISRDQQALANTSFQRTYKDIAATGINPTFALTNGASTASSAAAVASTQNKEEVKIAKQNADSNSKMANAQMINAYANSAKAISSFLPNFNFNSNKSVSSALVRSIIEKL